LVEATALLGTTPSKHELFFPSIHKMRKKKYMGINCGLHVGNAQFLQGRGKDTG